MSIDCGKIVYSKAGRDKNRYFIVVEKIDENYVYICDGCLRKIEKPKKKKIKHLLDTGKEIEYIKKKIFNNQKVNNAEIRRYLSVVSK